MGRVSHSNGEPKFSDDKGVILGILDHQPGKRVPFVYHQLGLSYVVELDGGVDGVLLRYHPDPKVVDLPPEK